MNKNNNKFNIINTYILLLFRITYRTTLIVHNGLSFIVPLLVDLTVSPPAVVSVVALKSAVPPYKVVYLRFREFGSNIMDPLNERSVGSDMA